MAATRIEMCKYHPKALTGGRHCFRKPPGKQINAKTAAGGVRACAYLFGQDPLGLAADPALPHFVQDIEEERVFLPENLAGNGLK